MADPVDDLLPLLGVVPAGDGDGSDSSSDSFDSDIDDEEDIQIHIIGSDDDHQNEDIVDHGDGDRQEDAAPAEERRRRKRQNKKEKKKKSPKEDDDTSTGGQQLIVNFDQSLPSAHSYLGNDLEEVRGRTIFEENSVVNLPLLLLPSVILVPGQVIPLQLYRQRLVAMVRRVKDQDKTFGVINLSKGYGHDRDDGQYFSALGCTAEIFSMKEEMDEPSGISTVRVKARGRQRFKVLEIKSEITGDVTGKVKILPEVSLTHVLEGAWMPSHRKFMVPRPDDSDMIKTAVDRQGRILTSVDLRQKHPVTKLYAANYTWWPPWVYKMYDIDWLVEQIRAELHSWCPASLPPDPVDLSFWVAHNLPVNDEMRLRLLSFDSVVQRLRYGLSVIRKSGKLLCCDSCQLSIASKKDVFSMCQEGPLGAFVNPGGYVHEMFTVLAVDNLSNIGGSSTEHSWFPGYAWTIVQCRGCHSHMGWMFTATNKSLSPRKFWGLCRTAIKTSFGTIEADEEKELESFVM